MIMCDTCKSVARTVATPYEIRPARYFTIVHGWTGGIRSYCDYHINSISSAGGIRSIFVTMEDAQLELLRRTL